MYEVYFVVKNIDEDSNTIYYFCARASAYSGDENSCDLEIRHVLVCDRFQTCVSTYIYILLLYFYKYLEYKKGKGDTQRINYNIQSSS